MQLISFLIKCNEKNICAYPLGSALRDYSILAVAFTSIWFGWIGYMPDLEDLQNPISRYASQVYSVDGKILGTYNMNRENRVHVDYNGISPYLVKALVATEDERFYDHSGIDFIALTRAIVKRGILGQKVPVEVLP